MADLLDRAPETVDIEFIDVQVSFEEESDLPFEDMDAWTVLAACGDGPELDSELGNLRVVMLPVELSRSSPEIDWLDRPLQCPVGWYTTL